MAIDLNDPSTWDDDAALSEVAKTGTLDVEDAPEPAKETAETPPETPEGQSPAAEEPPEGEILAADGKNTIPYNVLRDTREQLREAKNTAAQLQAELEALQRKAPEAKAEPETNPAPAQRVLPPEVKAHLDKVRENWGEDIAQQAERTYWLEQHAQQQQQIIDKLSNYITNQQYTSQRTEQDQIEEAIAASPKLHEWAVAEDQEWFERSTELHATLMKTDRNYAAASWYDRMKLLPTKVEALFGGAPGPVNTDAAKEKVKAALTAPPRSLSEMSGGATPERNEIDKLEDLSGNQLTAHMAQLANDPKKFEAYLRSIS